jgi:hypothetical protein
MNASAFVRNINECLFPFKRQFASGLHEEYLMKSRWLFKAIIADPTVYSSFWQSRFCYLFTYLSDNLDSVTYLPSDGQQFHKYQQFENYHLSSQLIEHIKINMTYDFFHLSSWQEQTSLQTMNRVGSWTVICSWLVIFSGKICPPRYSWNIVERGVKHDKHNLLCILYF